MSVDTPSGLYLVRGRPLVRYVLGVLLGLLVLAILLSRKGELAGATTRLSHVNWWWATGALAAEALAMSAYAAVQRVVLRAAGAQLGLGALFAITMANNAIALSIPGEPVFSSAFRFRQYRQRGTSAAGASWAILTLIVAQAVGLILIIFVGLLVSLLGGSGGPKSGVALGALIVVSLAGLVFVRRGLLVAVAGLILRASRRVTGHPRGDLLERVETLLNDVAAIRVSRAHRLTVVALALGAWLLDGACLICAIQAVHAGVPWYGVFLAYGIAQVVAVFPIVPGGLGLVEGSLAVILVAYGMARVPAISSVLAYRIINFWITVGLGWLSFAGLMLHGRRNARAPRAAESAPVEVVPRPE